MRGVKSKPALGGQFYTVGDIMRLPDATRAISGLLLPRFWLPIAPGSPSNSGTWWDDSLSSTTALVGK